MPKIPMPEPLPADVVQTWWDYFVAKRGLSPISAAAAMARNAASRNSMIARCGRPGLVCNTRAGHGRRLHIMKRSAIAFAAVPGPGCRRAARCRVPVELGCTSPTHHDKGRPRTTSGLSATSPGSRMASRGSTRSRSVCRCCSDSVTIQVPSIRSGSWPVMGVPPMAVAVSRCRG